MIAAALVCVLWEAAGVRAVTTGASRTEGNFHERRFLEDELALAKTNDVYCVLDIPGRGLTFKARGIPIKTIPFVSAGEIIASAWLDPSKPLTLRAKNAEERVSPGRRAGGGKKMAEPSASVTVTDMPGHYRLLLGDATELYVFPVARSFTDHVVNTFEGFGLFGRTTCVNLRRLYGRASQEPPPRVIVAFLRYRDAQALFWALREGDALIIPNFHDPTPMAGGPALEPG